MGEIIINNPIENHVMRLITFFIVAFCYLGSNLYGQELSIVANSTQADVCILEVHSKNIVEAFLRGKLPVSNIGTAVFLNEVDSFPKLTNGIQPKASQKYAGGLQCVYNGVAFTTNEYGSLNCYSFFRLNGLLPEKKYYVKVYNYQLDSTLYYKPFKSQLNVNDTIVSLKGSVAEWHMNKLHADAAFYTKPRIGHNFHAATFSNSQGGKLVISDVNNTKSSGGWGEYGNKEQERKGYETRPGAKGDQIHNRLLVFQPQITSTGQSVVYNNPNSFNYKLKLSDKSFCDFAVDGTLICEKRRAIDTIDQALYNMPYLSFSHSYDTLFLRLENQTRFKLINMSAYTCLTTSFDSVFVLDKTRIPSSAFNVQFSISDHTSGGPTLGLTTGCFNAFLKKNKVYPNSAKAIGLKGSVVVDCLINKEGNVLTASIFKDDLKALNSSDAAVINDAVRDLKKTALNLSVNLPIFHPALINGNPVFSTYRLYLSY